MPWLNGLDNFYVRTLKWSLHHKRIIIAGAVGLIIFSIVLAIIFIKIKFIPQTDEGQISAEIELQDGVRVDVSVKIARKIDACIIRHIPEKDMVSTTA